MLKLVQITDQEGKHGCGQMHSLQGSVMKDVVVKTGQLLRHFRCKKYVEDGDKTDPPDTHTHTRFPDLMPLLLLSPH